MSEQKNPNPKRYYASVPAEQVARLEDFRRRYLYTGMQLGRQNWRYIDTGCEGRVIFILAGATTVAEISFNTIAQLARSARVIAPDYPPIPRIQDLFDGYLELLDRLGVDRFTLMGGSYGGWLAQSFLRYAPERVDRLVLSAIGPPDPENSRQLARLLWLLRLAPAFVLRLLLNRAFTRLVGEGESTPEQSLLLAQLDEIMHTRVGRGDILAALARLVDQTEHYRFTPADLSEWPGRILILMGSEDPATPPAKREAMRALYPQAQIGVFEGADHSLAVAQREAYYLEIEAFLGIGGKKETR